MGANSNQYEIKRTQEKTKYILNIYTRLRIFQVTYLVSRFKSSHQGQMLDKCLI